MTRTKNFKVLAVLSSVAAALAASLLVLSLFEKPAKAQAGGAEDTQGRTVDKLDKDPEGNPIAAGELIVTYQEDPSSLTAQDAAQEVEGEAKKNFPAIDAQLLSFPDVKDERAEETREQALEEKKTALEEDANVEAVDYNHLIKPDQAGLSRDRKSIGWPDMTPNDQFYSQQWGYPKINAPQAWDTTQGSDQVKVAVIDTGIDSNHPDLKGKIAAQYDFANNDATAEETTDEYYGHGTHVSGTVAATTNNTAGVAGTCPNCKIMMAKYWDEINLGFTDTVLAGINWSVNNGAKVINMSLGGPSQSISQERAINNAWNKGIVIVAAAGNSGDGTTHYPGAYTNSIAVAATDQDDKQASFSTHGNWVDVAAPGVSIYSTHPTADGSYKNQQGTSMATPHVAGLAGLLASQGKTNSQIRNAIETTTVDLGTAGKDQFYGNGRVNAQDAVGSSDGDDDGNDGGDDGDDSGGINATCSQIIGDITNSDGGITNIEGNEFCTTAINNFGSDYGDNNTEDGNDGGSGGGNSATSSNHSFAQGERWFVHRIHHLKTKLHNTHDAAERKHLTKRIHFLKDRLYDLRVQKRG